jgi:transcriptional regulator with XRE-family HTH domain
MSEESVSTTRLRHIGKVLRTLRDNAGLTQAAAGRRMERSGASLSIIEKGNQLLRLRDLAHILNVYGLPEGDALRHGLLELCRQQLEDGWWSEFKGLISPAARDYASLEWYATSLDSIETQFIPGLFQTEDYANSIWQPKRDDGSAKRKQGFLEFRLRRQQVLTRENSLHFRTIIDEAALRRVRAGKDVMRAQLHMVLEISHQERISVQVLPYAATVDPGVNGSCHLLDIGCPAIFSTVLIDHLTGRLVLEGEQDRSAHRDAFARASTCALSETDSRTFIHRII